MAMTNYRREEQAVSMVKLTSSASCISSWLWYLKDFYPLPGARIKQYVLNHRAERAWELETCPKIDIAGHRDNYGDGCRNTGGAPWCDLNDHDCCADCNDMAIHTRHRPDVVEWLKLKSARPDPEACGKELLSDEVVVWR